MPCTNTRYLHVARGLARRRDGCRTDRVVVVTVYCNLRLRSGARFRTVATSGAGGRSSSDPFRASDYRFGVSAEAPNTRGPLVTVDFFWEQADTDGSGEHPLERELGAQLDALARFQRLIHEAQLRGEDNHVEVLLRQQERVERVVARLRSALDSAA
jgi:hypothetical protein